MTAAHRASNKKSAGVWFDRGKENLRRADDDETTDGRARVGFEEEALGARYERSELLMSAS